MSVLDLGSGTVKALVVQFVQGSLRVLGAAVRPAPPEDGARGQALLAACERALVAAEDSAGMVPTRVCIGLTPQRGLVTVGAALGERPTKGVPPTAAELTPLVAQAERTALVRARRRLATEFDAPPRLHPLNATVYSLRVDGSSVASLAAATGRRLELQVAAAFAPEAAVAEAAELASRLDLDVAGTWLTPFAVGGALAAAGLSPALVVDVGSTLTTVSVVGERWTEGATTLPLGGAALEEHVAAEAGVSLAEARAAIAAHCLRAGSRGRGGAAVARLVAQAARHHAEVWLDALSAACVIVGQDAGLPTRLLLTGGASVLPELEELLAGTSWHAGLPFAAAPRIRRPVPGDVTGVRADGAGLPAAQAVPVLCLAALATGACPPPTPFDGLLRANADTRGR